MVSPDRRPLPAFNCEETLTTLQFGRRAKFLKNAVIINKTFSIEELQVFAAAHPR